jgi:hypothetical protein
MRTGTARALVAVVLLALHGCGAEQAADSPGAKPTATPTPVSILRIGDDGASVALDVGGTATITLTGSPTCRSETPSCETPDVMWSADFTVR